MLCVCDRVATALPVFVPVPVPVPLLVPMPVPVPLPVPDCVGVREPVRVDETLAVSDGVCVLLAVDVALPDCAWLCVGA